jgi:uncharacterized damage-inducible protein DinB
MPTQLPYPILPNTPEEINAATVLSRLVDGIAFRYRWSTEDLTDNEFHFRPVEGSMNMEELLKHIYTLAYVANTTTGGGSTERVTDFKNLEHLRKETLTHYDILSKRLLTTTNSDLESYTFVRNETILSFWFLINGHLADALTHIGQVLTWRRIAGNPQPSGVSVLFGKKVDV